MKEYYGRPCFRCGRRFKKNTSSSKYFCPDCVNIATKDDKKTTLWYSTAKFHLKRFGKEIACEYCQKPINVLEKIQTVGQYHQHFYHSSCWEKLAGEDSQKETISYILVCPDGSRREMVEVV
jgi:DNA-directed RNA polymerase subunit RPC12/RpoP